MDAREPVECLYHGDRVQFHVLTKGLKENRVIPKTYLTRLASAVCSCRRHKTDIRLLMTTEDLCHVTCHLRDVELPNMSTSLRNYLHRIISETHSLEQYGEIKLLYVVYNALVNNTFDELTYNAINSRPKQLPTTETSTGATQQRRMTKKQFIFMKNKKLSRKDHVRKIILPMFARNIRKFMESKEYKCVKERYEDAKLFLWFCDDENTNFINSNQKKTSVKLYMKDKCSSLSDSVDKELIQIAAKLQANLDTERQKLQQNLSKKRRVSRGHLDRERNRSRSPSPRPTSRRRRRRHPSRSPSPRTTSRRRRRNRTRSPSPSHRTRSPSPSYRTRSPSIRRRRFRPSPSPSISGISSISSTSSSWTNSRSPSQTGQREVPSTSPISRVPSVKVKRFDLMPGVTVLIDLAKLKRSL